MLFNRYVESSRCDLNTILLFHCVTVSIILPCCMMNRNMHFGILLDFDGTITTIDTLQYLLDRYGMADWRKLDDQIEFGEYRESDALKIQMSSLRISPQQAIDELIAVIAIRDGFKEFFSYAKQHSIPIRIVSGGFGEIIHPFLQFHGIDCEVVANRIAGFNAEGGWLVSNDVEPLPDCRYSLCKCKSADWLHESGSKVLYIGDGITDFCVAGRSDIVYALKNGALERKCIREHLPYFSYTNFFEISAHLECVE